MKRLGILTVVCMLVATMFAGCRAPQSGTTGSTPNNSGSTSSTVRPEPTITKPEGSGITPGSSNAAGGQRNMTPMG